jgi:hypothetical protein
VAEFVMLPKAFITYVNAAKRLPVSIDISVETLQTVIETVCLEASVDHMGLKNAEENPSGSNL